MTSQQSVGSLAQVLAGAEPARIFGVYDAVSARLAERAGATAVWASGLCIAVAMGVPDGEIATYDALLGRIAEIRRGTSLPILADGNAGFGDELVVAHLVPLLERAGAQGVCLEDKAYPRRNSFAEGQPMAIARAEDFGVKIHAATAARGNRDFLVVARIEGLIAGHPAPEVLRRAALYLEAGADAIVVHSKSLSEREVLDVARRWSRRSPLIVIPTTYPTLTLPAARDAGISALIYANQLLRAATQAMNGFLDEALKADSLSGCETPLMSVAEVLDLATATDPAPEHAFEGVRDRLRDRYRALTEAVPATRD